MANPTLPEAPALVRCGARDHVGERLIPASRFYPSQAKKRAGAYCAECYREWKRQRDARRRGEVAADVGPDYTALAEAQLYPGRPYAALTSVERERAIALARAMARAAGLLPADESPTAPQLAGAA